MPLSHRPATPHDLDACWRIVRGDRFYPPALRETRTAFWQHLMAKEAMLSVVVEDSERPPETRLRAFSTSVFVSDAFAAEAKATLPPNLPGQIHRQLQSGTSPILDPAAVRRANAREGLTLAINGYGVADPLSGAETVPVMEIMFGCFFSYHAGYQIKDFLVENYDRGWALMNIAAGLRTRTDYGPYFAAHPEPAVPPDQRPILLGLTREEAFESLGNRYFPLFVYARPRFRFSPAEQRLLRQALDGGTNEDCAQALGVSLSAVKKHWEAIYARVTLIAPEQLSLHPYEAPPEKTRGLEKKDRLLAYLRQHPEELCPYQP